MVMSGLAVISPSTGVPLLGVTDILRMHCFLNCVTMSGEQPLQSAVDESWMHLGKQVTPMSACRTDLVHFRQPSDTSENDEYTRFMHADIVPEFAPASTEHFRIFSTKTVSPDTVCMSDGVHASTHSEIRAKQANNAYLAIDGMRRLSVVTCKLVDWREIIEAADSEIFLLMMKPSRFPKNFSRAIRSNDYRLFARISRFDSEAEKLLPGSTDSVAECDANWSDKLVTDENWDDPGIDYDSCISPSSRAPWRTSGALSVECPQYARSFSMKDMSENNEDDDSCMTPCRTPRWSVHDKEKFREMGKGASFKDLHKLLLDGCITHFSACPTKGKTKLEISPIIEPKSVIMAGSFNPLHHGHEELAKKAATDAPGANGKYFFEISTVNVDKGPISAAEMEKRVIYITRKGHPCLLSNALLFDAKAELYPNCIFAIGFDTYTRVVNPKYYPKVTGGIEATMARIEANGCEFFVGGRLTEEGNFTTLGHSPSVVIDSLGDRDDAPLGDDEFELIELPPATPYRGKSMCLIQKDNDGKEIKVCSEEPVSPIFSGFEQFRHDISSTEIRSMGFSLPEVDSAKEYTEPKSNV